MGRDLPWMSAILLDQAMRQDTASAEQLEAMGWNR
jgi:hypothetical protein